MVTIMPKRFKMPWEEEGPNEFTSPLLQNFAQMQQAQQTPPQDGGMSRENQALVDLIHNAGAKLGTLGGVTPPSAENPIGRYFDLINSARDARKTEQVNNLGIQNKTLSYLQGIKEKEAEAKRKNQLEDRRYDFDREKYNRDTDFANRKLDQDRGLKEREFDYKKERAGERAAEKKKIEYSPGEKKIEEETVKDLVDFRKNAQKSLEDIGTLRRVIEDLKKDETISGSYRGKVSDNIRWITHPKAMKVKSDVESIALGTIKTLLSGVTSDQDVKRVLSKSYIPEADTRHNIKVVSRLLHNLEQGFKIRKAQSDYFDENGTLRGFKAELPTLSEIAIEDDLTPETDKPEVKETKAMGDLSADEQKELERLRVKYGRK